MFKQVNKSLGKSQPNAQPAPNRRFAAWLALSGLLTLFVLLLLSAPALANTSEAPFQVVVNAANPVSNLDRGQVSKMFLKRVRSWEHKQAVEPVDQAESSDIRESFTQTVHRRSVKAVKSYWLRMIFSGEASAPLELDGDAAVLAYVAQNADAIGYVRSNVSLPAGVKVIALAD